jgi:nucleotide-binding universal stress UspA family protein
MFPIRTVLCPVDFSPASSRQVDIAADLCRAFSARLVLHHSIGGAGVGAAVGWMWAASHPPDSPDAIDLKLRAELARAAHGLSAEAHITQGPALQAVLTLGDAVQADLVVLSTHGETTADHTSIADEVLRSGERAVLVLHDEGLEGHTPHFTLASNQSQVVIVPTDLTRESRQAVDLGLALARKLPIELHLIHLRAHARTADRPGPSADEARRQLAALVPVDLDARVHVHVEDGDAALGIVRAARELSASCIVMGEHARGLLRRWFTRDTSRAVLYQAPCPVWYVPGRAA